MSVNIVNNDGSLSRVAGGTLYADSPIGTISPFGGSVVPSGYLLCDGAEVLKTAYAELYEVIGDAFGTASDNTKFKLPDLRGEFLRGAGTNSHTNQGNGGTVGEHQDATEHLDIRMYTSLNGFYAGSETDPSTQVSAKNVDYKASGRVPYRCEVLGTKTESETQNARYSARPTNTSVNYIIKAIQIPVPADIEAGVRSIISVSEMPMDVDPTSAEIDAYPVGAMWLETDD